MRVVSKAQRPLVRLKAMEPCQFDDNCSRYFLVDQTKICCSFGHETIQYSGHPQSRWIAFHPRSGVGGHSAAVVLG